MTERAPRHITPPPPENAAELPGADSPWLTGRFKRTRPRSGRRQTVDAGGLWTETDDRLLKTYGGGDF